MTLVYSDPCLHWPLSTVTLVNSDHCLQWPLSTVTLVYSDSLSTVIPCHQWLPLLSWPISVHFPTILKFIFLRVFFIDRFYCNCFSYFQLLCYLKMGCLDRCLDMIYKQLQPQTTDSEQPEEHHHSMEKTFIFSDVVCIYIAIELILKALYNYLLGGCRLFYTGGGRGRQTIPSCDGRGRGVVTKSLYCNGVGRWYKNTILCATIDTIFH